MASEATTYGTPAGDRPFDDVRDLVRSAPPGSADAAAATAESLAGMAAKTRDFGKLEDAAKWLAQWQKRHPPRIQSPRVVLFAGSHGLASGGVTESSDDATRGFVDALLQGRAPLSAIAEAAGAQIRVFNLAVGMPTPRIDREEAMSEKDCARTIAYGFEAVAEGPVDLIALGVAGAGIGTAAAAVACALYGGSPDYWVRPGPGTPERITAARSELVAEALFRHRDSLSDPLHSLRCLGGRELAACVGAIIAARHQAIPVVLDGFATTIAAGVVHAIEPRALDHVIAGHVTRRPAHEAALERIGKKPLMDLEFQTGSGIGSATAISLLKIACAPLIAEPAGRAAEAAA